ncbi:GlpM family protein [Stenotrophomonas acidaminiphila]
MISLFLKSLLGALAVLAIALLARSKSFFIAGLVPLFPTFALIAHYIVGSGRSGADLQKTALFGLWSLFPYAGYLVAVYFGSVRWPLAVTLGVATAVWVLMALAMIVLWGRLHPAAAGA